MLATLLAAAVLAAGCGGDVDQPQAVAAAGADVDSARELPFRFFSPRSPWNRQLDDDAPLDPESKRITDRFKAEIRAERRADAGPSITTTRWSVPIYTVPRDQPTVRVAHANPNGFSPALQSAWNAVPLPARAEPAGGTDRHLVVWQPSSDTLWEFWRLQRAPDGWWARWGGAMRHVSKSWGVYGPGAWPGATRSWGGSASSLSLAGGVITFEDMRRGEIDHALGLSIPEVRAGAYSLPARRTDGLSPSPLALPEGAHLRLDPSLNLDALDLPPFTLMLARAAQRYGIFVRSRSGVINFVAQDPPTASNPYEGPAGFFEGLRPNELIASFPWDHLQLLRMELRVPWKAP